MVGKVLNYDKETKSGIILNDNDIRYNFKLEDVKNSETLLNNQVVDFIPNENNIATDIYINQQVSKNKNNIYPIISLITSIIGFQFFILSIIGIIFGHMAIYNINKYPNKYNGKIMARIGLILGYISLILPLTYFGIIGAMVFLSIK